MSIDNLQPKDVFKFECLKCGAPATTYFKHVEQKSRMFFTSKYVSEKKFLRSLRVPVCSNCDSDLKTWTNKYSTTRSSYVDVICEFVLGVGIGVVLLLIRDFFPQDLRWISILVPTLLFFLVGIGIIYKIYKSGVIRKKPNSPFRYIDFRLNKPYVRPGGKGSWIKYTDWLKKTGEIDISIVEQAQLEREKKEFELEHDINVFYCPNCGAKYNMGTDFCPNCGKDLRPLY